VTEFFFIETTMVQCAIADCKSNRRDCVKNESLSFHKFPQNNKLLSKKWLVKCKRLDSVNVKNASVCSLHFNPEDFVLDFRKALMGWNVPNKLKPEAYPSVNLPATKILTENPRNERAQKRKTKDVVNSLITGSPKNRKSEVCPWGLGKESYEEPKTSCKYYGDKQGDQI
jgi:THAP domain